MQRISVMLAATALGLSLSAAPTFAVDYIVGEPWCTPEAVNFIEERDGDRYHWCLAEKPAPFQQGIYSADVTSTGPVVMPGKPAAPAPVTPDPVDPDPEEPGDCLKVSDCPNEPDPKPEPCERKIDCVGPAPDPKPTGPRLCNAKGECRP